MTSNLLAGLLAGVLTFALFSFGTSGRGELGILIQISCVPLFAAGLGFGWRAALCGALVVAAGLLTQRGLPQAFSFALIFGLPVVALSAIATAKHGALDKGRRLGWMLAAAALVAGLLGGFAASAFSIATSVDQAELTRQITAQMKVAMGDAAVSGQAGLSIEDVIGFVFKHIGELIAVGALVLILGNMALAAGILRLTGRAQRPLTDVALIDLPFGFLLGLLVALGATLLPGAPGLFARALSVAGIGVLAITGLAIFHYLLRGHGFRFPGLIIAYLALLVLNLFAIAIFALLGLIEPLLGLRPKPDATKP